MKNWIFYLYTLLIPLEGAASFHVCALANRETVGFQQFLYSCHYHGIQVELLGWGQPYQGGTQKLLLLENYLNALPEEDLLLFVDSFDVVFLTGKEEISTRFQKMNLPFLMSAERNCYPHTELRERFPPSPTSFRYLNSGTFIGPVKEVKKVLQGLVHPIPMHSSDQGLVMKSYIERPFPLDYQCAIALPLYQVKKEELVIDPLARRIKLKESGVFPCMLHGNGSSKGLCEELFCEIYPNALLPTFPYKGIVVFIEKGRHTKQLPIYN